MHYGVFVAVNAIVLLLASVDCKRIRSSRPFVYESPHPPVRLQPLPTPWRDNGEDPDIDEDDPCSEKVNTELAKIRADLRVVKSLVEGLRQKLDPDFTPVVETEEPTAEPRSCPEGFDYLPEARGCYKAITETLEWSSAMEHCQSLNPSARLISIDSREESEDVTKYLKKKLARARVYKGRNRCSRPGQPVGHAAFWTSGQRVNMSDCSSEFVWKTTAGVEAPLTYTQWLDREPNCWGGDEKCVEILLDRRSVWNDVMCYVRSCFICEYDLN